MKTGTSRRDNHKKSRVVSCAGAENTGKPAEAWPASGGLVGAAPPRECRNGGRVLCGSACCCVDRLWFCAASCCPRAHVVRAVVGSETWRTSTNVGIFNLVLLLPGSRSSDLSERQGGQAQRRGYYKPVDNNRSFFPLFAHNKPFFLTWPGWVGVGLSPPRQGGGGVVGVGRPLCSSSRQCLINHQPFVSKGLRTVRN